MKKYLSILVAVMLAAMSFTLTSCGDDDNEDEPENPEAASIIGRWNCTDVTMKSDFATEAGMQEGDFIQFNADGSCSYSEGGISYNAKYKKESNKVTIYDSNDPESFDIPVEYEIKSLTEKELVLFANLYIATWTGRFQRVN